MRIVLLIAFMSTVLTACYRMPNEDDFCTIPTHNNPKVTRQNLGDFTPTMKY
jgi:hypothetical protein